MDFMILLIGLGLLFTGFAVGYSMGSIVGRRLILRRFECDTYKTYEPCVVRESRSRLDSKDILNAEEIE